MIRKSIGLALLGLAVGALILTVTMGSATATYDPFDPAPYYYALGLPSTGQSAVTPDNLMLRWLIPSLSGVGVAIVALVLVRLRLRHR